MRTKIRKISVGPDYKNAMHYQLGQTVCKDHEILSIDKGDDGEIHVLIGKGTDAYFWKSFTNTVPMSIEYNIDFE
jgi:hypothetical protein